MKFFYSLTLVASLLLFGAWKLPSYTSVTAPTANHHFYWNWKKLSVTKLSFPGRDQSGTPFLWGFATSALQVEGNCPNSAWDAKSPWFSALKLARQKQGEPFVAPGVACDQRHRYKEDIALLKQFGCNSYRFSIKWSNIEPRPGQFNKEALQYYIDLCTELITHDIKPIVTLHHYADPIWFLKRGGFEKERNIRYFVRFCNYVFRALYNKVHLWLTFNSPSGYAMKGYWSYDAPPCKHDMQLAITVLKNICLAHVQVYHNLKQALAQIDPQATTNIGILKNIYQLDPWDQKNPIHRLKAKMGNDLTNTCMYEFFRTGHFKVHVPLWVNVQGHDIRAARSLDFVGLNYYCHGYCTTTDSTFHPEWEEKTGCAPHWHKKYFVYPEGLYRAIQELSDNIATPLQIPIYITENGIGTHDDATRIRHNSRYLYALSKAIQDGYDVRGYIQWSLLDTYEWGSFNKGYGAYHVNFDKNSPNYLNRTLKPGARYYQRVIQAYNQALDAGLPAQLPAGDMIPPMSVSIV